MLLPRRFVAKTITKQVSDKVKQDIRNLIVSEPELSIDDLNKHIQKMYGLFQETALSNVGIASEDPKNKEYYLINPRYDERQCDILEDVYDNDWTANECCQKKMHFVMGKHGSTAVGIKKRFRKESEKNLALEAVNNDPVVIEALDDIEKKLVDWDAYNLFYKAGDSALVYGRSAIQILRENIALENPGQELETFQDNVTKLDNKQPVEVKGDPIGLKLLNSRRLGRVKVSKLTYKVVAVEYLDIKKIDAEGNEIEIPEEEKYIPISDLIYFVNDDGNIATNSQFIGISRLESIVNISQVKRIIMNQNIKEAAKSHYAGNLIAQFPAETEQPVMNNWIAQAAKAAGRWFAHKLTVGITQWKADTDLGQYKSLVELIDNAIIRAIGIPSALVGYESVKYSNMEELLIAWREGELVFWRIWVKDILQKYLLNPMFQAKISSFKKKIIQDPDYVAQQELEKLETKEEAEAEEEEYKDTALNRNMFEPKDKSVPPEKTEAENQLEQVEPYVCEIEKEDLKITYEFQDISFMPKPDVINGLKVLVDMGVPLTVEMILRASGYDEWVEPVMREKHKKDLEKKQADAKRLKDLEKMKAEGQFGNNNNNMMNDSNQEDIPGQSNKIPEQLAPYVAKASDKIFDKIAEKKLEVLELIKKKIEEL